MRLNILLAGVGGQGIITAGEILGQAAMFAGWCAKKAEVHGMAQRGGSVVSHVRMNPSGEVASPIIPDGQADVLVALEVLEGARWLWMLAPSGTVVADTRQTPPVDVAAGRATYPEGLLDALARRGRVVEATAAAEAAGDPRAANSLVLGVVSRLVELPLEAWRQAFETVLRPQFLPTNWELFERGRLLG